jgi:hypothetical protein
MRLHTVLRTPYSVDINIVYCVLRMYVLRSWPPTSHPRLPQFHIVRIGTWTRGSLVTVGLFVLTQYSTQYTVHSSTGFGYCAIVYTVYSVIALARLLRSTVYIRSRVHSTRGIHTQSTEEYLSRHVHGVFALRGFLRRQGVAFIISSSH